MYVLFDHNGIKLEINGKILTGKISKSLKLNNSKIARLKGEIK